MNHFHLYLLIFYIVRDCEGLIQQCGNGSVLEVVENSSFNLTCSGYTGPVEWTYTPHDSLTALSIGVCDISCQLKSIDNYTLTAINNSASVLTSWATSRKRAGDSYACSSSTNPNRCQVQIIVPVELSPLSVAINKADSGWTINGNVTITRAFSSQRNYTCQWFKKESFQNAYTALPTNVSWSNPSDDSDRTGNCSFSEVSFNTTSNYTYKVVASPGGTQNISDTLVIVRPSTLSAFCNVSNNIPENTSTNCTCNTSSVGKPPGRLRWLLYNKNGTLESASNGTYDVTNLIMTSKLLTRNDTGMQFRCTIDWAVLEYSSSPPFTVDVSYGPDIVTIPENSTFITTSSGSLSFTLTCQTNGVKPNADLLYSWTGLCLHSIRSTCSISPRPPSNNFGGDVKALITCNATNPYSFISRQATFQLDLKYPPSSSPTINSSSEGISLLTGNSVTLTCEVLGGDPPVMSVSLTCPGHQSVKTSGQSSRLTIPSLSASDHNIVCSCSGEWTVSSYYTLSGTYQLTVHYPASVTGFMMNNVAGNQTVTEGSNVVFTCTATGFPTPNITIVKQVGKANIPSATKQDAILTLPLSPTQCHHSGYYKCGVRNTLGQIDSQPLMLTVRCTPRLVDNSLQPFNVTFLGDPLDIEFDLIAYPTVTEVRFAKAGSVTDAGQEVQTGTVKAKCSELDGPWLHHCVITISSFKASDAGTYYVVFFNSGGSGVTFNINVKVEGDEDTGGLSAGAAAGITFIVVLIVVAAVVAGFGVWLWRRHWVLPWARHQASSGDRYGNDRMAPSPLQAASGLKPKAKRHKRGHLKPDPQARQNTSYDGLQWKETDTNMSYSSLERDLSTSSVNHYQNVPRSNPDGCPMYENTAQSDNSNYVNVNHGRKNKY